MKGSTIRLEAVSNIASRAATESTVNFSDESPETVFGSNTFSLTEMEKALSPEAFKSIKDTIGEGKKLDESIADDVAEAMKNWAISKGATHFTHIFYPLTGYTAEKHDSFYDPSPDGTAAISNFKGKTLIQGEPDASSFPSGGIRATHTARGYTAWDVTSPAYIVENPNGTTLNIPTSFVSWTGEALDKKTPVLKSMQALDKQARRILELFGHKEITKVTASSGPEQEYFLIDKSLAFARPDILAAGRTVFGAAPPKGQEFDDHYFGVINDRIMACMHDVDRELYKLGIPTKTRHNEVAPGQYEIAPVFESANVGSDHQQLIMTTLKRVADRHGLLCLLHEKPFAGLNGSGKHVNWSMGNSTQKNLLDPGDTPHENAQFLVFAGAVIRAVSKFAPLLRAAVASAGNDHRLGANEAPPAIISIFLGDQLTDVFDQIKKGGATNSKQGGVLNIGVDTLPDLPKDAGDRNRSSPFAFTGNRFEFRAVGSNQSISGPLVAMNTIVAESLDYIAGRLEGADDLNASIQTVLQEVMEEHGSVIFNGDNYSSEWYEEAAKRGLPNLKSTPEVLPVLTSPEVVELFEKYDVLSQKELHSRQEVYSEQYCSNVNVEANLVTEMAKTMIVPAAIRYLGELTGTAASMKQVGMEAGLTYAKEVESLIVALEAAIAELETAHAAAGEEMSNWGSNVLPAMLKVREVVDQLEGIVADDLWPLPTYQEMLFIR